MVTLHSPGRCALGDVSATPRSGSETIVDKGNSYLQEAKYREAIIEYQNAIQIDPKFGDAHFGLGEGLPPTG